MPDARCYTIPQILEKLQMPKSTFNRLKGAGKLPFLEELKPRLGRIVRYRADLIDRYLAGQWGQPRFFGSARKRWP
jgi:hypothetical protein